jgi:UPF0716 family protein affecting phage T7 exclusion
MLDYSSLFGVVIMLGLACLLATVFLAVILGVFFVVGEGAKRMDRIENSAGVASETKPGGGSH